jgi:hypothetical protein
LTELPNCIDKLVEIEANTLYQSPKCVVDNSEPMVMDNNMNKHSNFLFHTGVHAILQQPPLPEPINKLKEEDSVSFEL